MIAPDKMDFHMVCLLVNVKRAARSERPAVRQDLTG
jgi:hypothetical protein